MKHATEFWSGVTTLDTEETQAVLALPEGESGLDAAKQRLTADRLDRIAFFLACPPVVRERAVEWLGPRNVLQLAADVGCSVSAIERWRMNPAMVSRVAEMLYAAAVYAMPTILFGQMIAAAPTCSVVDGVERWVAGDTKAANFVATFGKFMRQGGGGSTINMNQNNITPVAEVDVGMSDQELQQRIARIVTEGGEDESDES